MLRLKHSGGCAKYEDFEMGKYSSEGGNVFEKLRDGASSPMRHDAHRTANPDVAHALVGAASLAPVFGGSSGEPPREKFAEF